MHDLFNWLFAQYQTYPTSLMMLEIIASAFGLMSVLLSKRGNVLVFPVGLISTALYVYLLWQWQLFGDMLINFYYCIMAIIGWINWSNHTQNHEVLIQTTNKKQWLGLIAMTCISFIFVTVIYYFKPVIHNNFSFDGVSLGFYHFSWMDYTDILTTGLFLMAMLLMAKRNIEHWLVWIVADAISIPLYFYKGMIFTSFQYLLFTIIAILGFISWRKKLSIQTIHKNLI